MTKRKPTAHGPYSPLEQRLYGLRKIADDMENGIELSAEERKFLCDALKRIGKGEDANIVLGVNAKRGQRKTKESADKALKMHFALSWIALAIQPIEEGGQGLTLDDAADTASKYFNLGDETLLTYWRNHPELRKPSFEAPISAHPIRKREIK
jgi:hypothetical protein